MAETNNKRVAKNTLFLYSDMVVDGKTDNEQDDTDITVC